MHHASILIFSESTRIYSFKDGISLYNLNFCPLS